MARINIPVPNVPGTFGAITDISSLDKDRDFIAAQDPDSSFEIWVSATSTAADFAPLTNEEGESAPANNAGGTATMTGSGTFSVVGEWLFARAMRTNGTAAVSLYIVGALASSIPGAIVDLRTKTVGSTSVNGVLGGAGAPLTSADIDAYGAFVVTSQAVASIVATLPPPTDAAATKSRWLGLDVACANGLVLYGQFFEPGGGAWITWNGTAWSPDTSVTRGGNETGSPLVIQTLGGETVRVLSSGAMSISAVTALAVTAPSLALSGQDAAQPGKLDLLEPAASGTNYTRLQSPAMAADVVWQLPNAAPTLAGQVLSAVPGAPNVLNWAGGVFVFATNTSAQNLVDNAALATITGWTEVTDTAGAFDPLTGIFTAPVTGIYAVSGSVCLSNVASNLHAIFNSSISIAGAPVAKFKMESNTAAVQYVRQLPVSSMAVLMTAGQALTLQANIAANGADIPLTNVAENNFLSIALLARTA